MKAIIIDQPGGPETLRERDLPDLQPMRGMLTIDVAYAGVGYVDVLLRRGAFGPLLPMPVTPGLEVSGYVRAIGEGVEGFSIGQPVVAMTLHELGGYATQAYARPALTVPLDQLGADIDLITAASAIVNLTTAYMAVKDASTMQEGDTVLVHAAAGGLGSFIGQVAKRLGAGRVLGTVGSAEKVKLAASLGYDAMFVRSDFVEQTLQATERKGVHVAFDPVGGAMRKQSLEVLRPLGQLVVVGNASGQEDVQQSYNELWLSNKTITGFALGGYSQIAPEEVGQAAKAALQMLAKKELHSEVFGVYPLHNASDVHILLEQGKTVGKLVLSMDS